MPELNSRQLRKKFFAALIVTSFLASVIEALLSLPAAKKNRRSRTFRI